MTEAVGLGLHGLVGAFGRRVHGPGVDGGLHARAGLAHGLAVGGLGLPGGEQAVEPGLRVDHLVADAPRRVPEGAAEDGPVDDGVEGVAGYRHPRDPIEGVERKVRRVGVLPETAPPRSETVRVNFTGGLLSVQPRFILHRYGRFTASN